MILRIPVALVFLMCFVLSDGLGAEEPVAAESPSTALVAELEPVAGTRVQLKVPEGFAHSSRFSGLEHPSGATILVIELPGAYSEVIPGMTADGLSKKGMKLLKSEDVEISEHAGRLLTVEQTERGIDYDRWLGLLGNDDKTVMIMGSCPKANAAELGAGILESILAAGWTPDMEIDFRAQSPITYQEPKLLKLAGSVNGMLIYNSDGRTEKKEPGTPTLVFGRMPGQAGPLGASVEDFAKNLFMQIHKDRSARIESSKEVAIDGLAAGEVTGTMEWEGVPMRAYLVFFASDTELYLLQGQAPEPEAENFLAEYKEVAHSIRRKQTSE